ncbi:MAG: hypothetical protein ABI794_12505 [Betaproteobacteria bacterium]
MRIIGFLMLLTIGASGVVFLVTGDRRWLRFAWQLGKFSLVIAGVFMALFVLERLFTVI